MALVSKIDSNVTGLRIAEEQSLGVLPGTPDWVPQEPNSYTDFGGELTTVARNPINPSRQRKKGVVTDLDASGGFDTDITQTNLQSILQGFFFADLRKKDELSVATTDTGGATDDYEPASGGDGFVANDLLFAKGFTDAAANGLKVVTGTPTATEVIVSTAIPTLTGETGTISRVGFEFGSAEVDIDASGSLPRLVRASGSKDFTDFGLIPGEWVYIGGDGASEDFATAANNGFCRVRQVGTTFIEFDKTQGTMVDETGTGLTIRLFFGRVLKNELGSLIKRRTYQLERTLGAPDDAQPAQIQSEYLTGAVPNELAINLPSADKATASLSFVAQGNEQRTAATGVKSGNRPSLVESDAFNTSSDFSVIKMSLASGASPTPLFAFLSELNFTVNNNNTGNKALGVLGSFEITSGTFEVGGSLTAYFADIAAAQAVRNNSDVTIHFHLVKANSGITMDLPLVSLGDGRPNVEQDQPITLPLSMDAAAAAKLDSTLDYTLLMQFWDYLPNAADL